MTPTHGPYQHMGQEEGPCGATQGRCSNPPGLWVHSWRLLQKSPGHPQKLPTSPGSWDEFLSFFPKGFFHQKRAEQLRMARELEQGSCVHDPPTSTAFPQFPGSQWGSLPSHPSALSTNDRKWFNIHIVHPGHE